MKTGPCYWRFKGEKAYQYGYVTEVGNGLYRMGLYHGCDNKGPIVKPIDVEFA